MIGDLKICQAVHSAHLSLKIKYASTSLIFSAGNAPGKSCLFANTSNVAPANL